MDIMSAIAGSGGVGAIAEQLGIDETTAQSGLSALLPRVVNGVESNGLPSEVAPGATDPQSAAAPDAPGGGLGGMLGGLLGGGGGGLGGLLGGGLLSSVIGSGVGNQVLGHIFGSKEVSRDVAADASQKTGIDPAILKKMLPIVAAMVAMHFITHRGGQAAPAGGAAQPEPAGGGILGSILGGLSGR